MIELLKQELYNPMPVIDQVLSIYAGTRGISTRFPPAKSGRGESVYRPRAEAAASGKAQRYEKLDDDTAAELTRHCRVPTGVCQSEEANVEDQSRADGGPGVGRKERFHGESPSTDRRRKAIRNIRKITRTMS